MAVLLLSGEVFVDVIDCQFNCSDFLGFLIGDFSFEFLFKGHYQFDSIQ